MSTVEERICTSLVFQKQIIVLRTQVTWYTGFLSVKLELENARNIEFQRVHRLGNRKAGQSRPIIVRFLRFPERELVFRKVRDLGGESEVKVYADLPKIIRDRRQKLWPKMKKQEKKAR